MLTITTDMTQEAVTNAAQAVRVQQCPQGRTAGYSLREIIGMAAQRATETGWTYVIIHENGRLEAIPDTVENRATFAPEQVLRRICPRTARSLSEALACRGEVQGERR